MICFCASVVSEKDIGNKCSLAALNNYCVTVVEYVGNAVVAMKYRVQIH